MVGDDVTQPTEIQASGEPVRDPTADLIGRSLLHFEVLDRLGVGGMGIVYQAIDRKLARRVALKVLGQRQQADDGNQRLLLREARSAAALVHPNIAAIHEVHDGPPAFYVMELVDGETLRRRIAAGRIPLADAVAWAAQIADALACAHATGIVHRDLKTDNVMIASSGRVKLLDFGLAKVLGVAELAASRDSHPALAETVRTSGTARGVVIGTPAYMSPEQARGDEVDVRSDVFSFGVVFYEMLSGASPFCEIAGVGRIAIQRWQEFDHMYAAYTQRVGGPATTDDECRKVSAHLYDLAGSHKQVADADIADCRASNTPEMNRCILAAKTEDAVGACFAH